MTKDIPIKESHIITFVSSPVFTFGVRLLLSPDGSSETGGVFVVIGGIDSFLNLGSAVTFQNYLTIIITWNCYDKRFALIYLIANLCFLCLDKKIHSFFQISVITSPSELVFPDIPLMSLSCTYFSSFFATSA